MDVHGYCIDVFPQKLGDKEKQIKGLILDTP